MSPFSPNEKFHSMDVCGTLRDGCLHLYTKGDYRFRSASPHGQADHTLADRCLNTEVFKHAALLLYGIHYAPKYIHIIYKIIQNWHFSPTSPSSLWMSGVSGQFSYTPYSHVHYFTSIYQHLIHRLMVQVCAMQLRECKDYSMKTMSSMKDYVFLWLRFSSLH